MITAKDIAQFLTSSDIADREVVSVLVTDINGVPVGGEGYVPPVAPCTGYVTVDFRTAGEGQALANRYGIIPS